MINIFLSKLIKLLHIIFEIFIISGPYVFNDIRILLFLLLCYLLVMTQWYLFNSCLLTDIEYKLSGQKSVQYKDGTNKSFMVVFLEKNLNMNEKTLFYIFTLIPVFNSIVCLLKILYTYNNKCIKYFSS
jgi:hypothetical protein